MRLVNGRWSLVPSMSGWGSALPGHCPGKVRAVLACEGPLSINRGAISVQLEVMS